MKEVLENSIYFGFFVTIGAYLVGLIIKKKLKLAIFNPLMLAILLVIFFNRLHRQFIEPTIK